MRLPASTVKWLSALILVAVRIPAKNPPPAGVIVAPVPTLISLLAVIIPTESI